MKFKTVHRDNAIVSMFISIVILIILINMLYPFSINIWLSIILSFLAAFFILKAVYSRWVTKHLHIDFTEHNLKNYQSQDGHIEIRIEQRGFMPIFNGQIHVIAGDHILFHNEFLTTSKSQTETRATFTVMGKSETIIRLPYTANKRGVGRVVDVNIFIPEIFGFNTLKLEKITRSTLEILIYPDKMKAERDDMRSKMLQGFIESNRALFNDPMKMIGVRDYEALDTMKQIHWKASAKTGELKSKVYEKVTRMNWLILINLRSTDHYAPPEYIEDIFMKIAYLTEEATKIGIPYLLITNMSTFDKRNYFKIAESSGPKHYKNTLEALARINSMSYTLEYHVLLRDVLTHESVPTHVVTCGHIDTQSADVLSSFERKGAFIYHLDTHGIKRHSGKGGD